ncbi:hypothetical protein E4K67_27115 [Desulfosporosinus fructosivorans]|uniref:Uracil-DNA glycosylase-like domain-containing protein n=1 Tax=Desulfosporosinus fructosivorans TaxID=2018669 RepID=A0A4Z0QXB6_9FIRM|nr:hypothetical protein [Desulfosporosinus fructosivorans]TGE35070.1 hypothetical protein E4K67_27115 [Desulfosporosinus fructosivorans]
MSGFARDKYIPLVNRDLGDRNYPIWLLINPKYPDVVSDIWRHVLDEIQDKVYREIHARIDTSNIYIRSVVSDCGIVPNTLNWWGNEVATEIKSLREIILEYNPKMLISFGAFPYEFVRRVFESKPEKGPKYWGASILKDEFERSLKKFDVIQTNMIPLLRRVITSDKLIKSDDSFSGSDRQQQYFQDVGTKIAEKVIQNRASLDIWMK